MTKLESDLFQNIYGAYAIIATAPVESLRASAPVNRVNGWI